MNHGIIKRFRKRMDGRGGYGFLTDSDTGKDFFFLPDSVALPEYAILEGQPVTYKIKLDTNRSTGKPEEIAYFIKPE